MARGKAIALNGGLQRKPDWQAPEKFLCNDCFNIERRQVPGLVRIAQRPWLAELQCETCGDIYCRNEVVAA